MTTWAPKIDFRCYEDPGDARMIHHDQRMQEFYRKNIQHEATGAKVRGVRAGVPS